MLKYILLTAQCKQWWNSLAVRYSSWIRHTILPQVGEVVWSGQDYTVNLRPSPDLCVQGGTDQDPSRYTDHKAADLHVHHHSPVTHACLEAEPLDREKANPSNGTRVPEHKLRDTCVSKSPSSGHKRLNVVCVHHHMFCLELWFCCFWRSLWWCVCCWFEPTSMVKQFWVPFNSYIGWSLKMYTRQWHTKQKA